MKKVNRVIVKSIVLPRQLKYLKWWKLTLNIEDYSSVDYPNRWTAHNRLNFAIIILYIITSYIQKKITYLLIFTETQITLNLLNRNRINDNMKSSIITREAYSGGSNESNQHWSDLTVANKNFIFNRICLVPRELSDKLVECSSLFFPGFYLLLIWCLIPI